MTAFRSTVLLFLITLACAATISGLYTLYTVFFWLAHISGYNPPVIEPVEVFAGLVVLLVGSYFLVNILEFKR